jgi:hypothetical protein
VLLPEDMSCFKGTVIGTRNPCMGFVSEMVVRQKIKIKSLKIIMFYIKLNYLLYIKINRRISSMFIVSSMKAQEFDVLRDKIRNEK